MLLNKSVGTVKLLAGLFRIECSWQFSFWLTDRGIKKSGLSILTFPFYNVTNLINQSNQVFFAFSNFSKIN
jgi:hypothetical protein